MSTNGSVQGPGVVQHPGARREMEAFDALPPGLRAVLRDAPIPVIAVGADRAVQAIGESAAIKHLSTSLERSLPEITRAAWGIDHPSLRRHG